MSRFINTLLVICAALLLFFAQSARWINHQVFNQQNFTNAVLVGIQQESSRRAIATAVVDKTLEDRPLVRQYAGERLIAVTAGLLDSDLSTQALRFLTNDLYAYVTAPNREDVKINLVAIKQPLAQIAELARNPETSEKIDSLTQDIPDEVTIVQSSDIPDLSGTVSTMLWLSPVLWLGSIGLFSIYIYRGRKQYAKRVYIVGGAVMLVAAVGVLTYPFVPPPVMSAIPNIELRPVAENLSQQFLGSFRSQMVQMFVLAGILTLLFNQRNNIRIAATRIIAIAPRSSKPSK